MAELKSRHQEEIASIKESYSSTVLKLKEEVQRLEEGFQQLSREVDLLREIKPIQVPVEVPIDGGEIIHSDEDDGDDLPEWKSDEFYAKYYANTKDLVRIKNYFKTLEPTPESFDAWIEDSCSDGVKLKKIWYGLKFHGTYLQFDKTKYEEMKDQILKKKQNGESLTKKTPEENDASYDAILETFEGRDLTVWSLFGFFLPPRRHDVFEIVVVDKLDESQPNSYCKETNTLRFTEFKNKKTKFIQTYEISSQDFPFLQQCTIDAVVKFLKSKPLGRLFPRYADKAQYGKNYKRFNKFNNTELRHFWARNGKIGYPTPQYVKLCNYMDNSLEVSVINYS
jgi:phage host-nuclease inhibitor protein Gam